MNNIETSGVGKLIPQKLSINIVHSVVGNFPLLENAPLMDNLVKLLVNSQVFLNDIDINILLNGEKAREDSNKILNRITLYPNQDYLADSIHDGITRKILVPFVGRELTFRSTHMTNLGNPDRGTDVKLKIWSLENPADAELVFPLGTARDILQELSRFTYYINVDEDDNFYDITELSKLQIAVAKMSTPIAAFGFNWNYYKYIQDEEDKENGRLWVHNKLNPLDPTYWKFIPKAGCVRKLEKPLHFDNYRGLCSWNLVHNKDYYKLHRLERPNVNKYDDCWFYSKLVQKCQKIAFIQAMIYDYHQEHGTMNKEKDPYLDEVTRYIIEPSFLITEIIQFENRIADNLLQL